MNGEIMRKEEVAEWLDCEPSTVEEKARNRELPAVKIGRSWLFPRQAMLQRLNEMALAKPEPPKPTGVIATGKKGRKAPPALPPLPL